MSVRPTQESSPLKSEEYASHTVRYNNRDYKLRIKLRDENGHIRYEKGTKIPYELTQKIDETAKAMLKRAEEDKLFSSTNPIVGFEGNSIKTQNGSSFSIAHTREWKIFEETVGWNRKKEICAPKASDRAELAITYPREPNPSITGPELAFLATTQLDPSTLGQASSFRSTSNIDSYPIIPTAVKLRILKSVTVQSSMKPLYRKVVEELRKQPQWDQSKTEQTNIREEIQRLEKTTPKHPLNEVNKKSVEPLYTLFLQKPAGEGISKEILWKIACFMNSTFPLKETLVEHYRAICRAKGEVPPTFTNDPNLFTTYWVDARKTAEKDHVKTVTNFMEAMVSWADTEGAKLEKNYPPSNSTAPYKPSLLLSYVPERLKIIVKTQDDLRDKLDAMKLATLQKLQTPIACTKKIVEVSLLPIRAVSAVFQGARAVYNYGPIERTKKAFKAVQDVFTTNPAGK